MLHLVVGALGSDLKRSYLAKANCKRLLYYLEQMGGESHPAGLQVSFGGCEMKGDGFLVIRCASSHSTPHLYPHVS